MTGSSPRETFFDLIFERFAMSTKSDLDVLNGSLATFSVAVEDNDVNAPHPRFAQYKPKTSGSSQTERRRIFLARQKEKRFDVTSLLRNAGDDNKNDSVENNSMEWCPLKQVKKPPRKYSNQIMLSEWLVEVPQSMSTDWLMTLCPVGKRSLVIAANGRTTAYSKSGYCVNAGFPSFLPGGLRNQKSHHGQTIIDCIFDEQNRIYYILDILCWNGHHVCDSDTDFRFYWLHTKLKEIPELTTKSKVNPYPFIELSKSPCSEEDIHKLLWNPLPFSAQLDGLLFFHKELKYEPGVTPLVGWLKGYMVPEMLNIDVPDSLKSQAPQNYTTMIQQLPQEFARHEQRKKDDEASMS